MALIECPECKNTISDSVRRCPKCGYPFFKIKWNWWLIGAFLLSVVSLLFSIVRVNAVMHITTETYIGAIMTVIGICATFIVGFQIYNSVEFRNKFNDLDKKQSKVLERSNDFERNIESHENKLTENKKRFDEMDKEITEKLKIFTRDVEKIDNTLKGGMNKFNIKLNNFDKKSVEFNGKMNDFEVKIEDFNKTIKYYTEKFEEIDKRLNETVKKSLDMYSKIDNFDYKVSECRYTIHKINSEINKYDDFLLLINHRFPNLANKINNSYSDIQSASSPFATYLNNVNLLRLSLDSCDYESEEYRLGYSQLNECFIHLRMCMNDIYELKNTEKLDFESEWFLKCMEDIDLAVKDLYNHESYNIIKEQFSLIEDDRLQCLGGYFATFLKQNGNIRGNKKA